MNTHSPFVEDTYSAQLEAAPESSVELPERIHRLEHEVTELRETIARFAELVLGEVKDLRQSHAELPAFPPGIAGELPITATQQNHHDGHSLIHLEPPPSRRPWLLMELLRDLTTTIRMYLDPRYRVRRATQLLVPLILALFAFNCFFFNIVFTLPFVSSALEKLADVILAVLFYKIVTREIVRYREVIAQLMAWQGHHARSTTVVIGAEPAMTRLETE